jgi:hypothetical protein
MSVLEIAKKLNGLEIQEGSKLYEALTKLPSLQELQLASVEAQIEHVSVEDIEGRAVENPLFQEDESAAEVDQEIAKEILARFEKHFVKFVKKTGIQEVDDVRKEAEWIRFMAQEAAERTAAGEPLNEEFTLEDWVAVSQGVFHDTGNNITLPLTTGKRKDGKFGAGSGGLGDKITKVEYELILQELKEEDLSDEVKNKLKDILIRADNVKYLDGGKEVKFLDEEKSEEKAEVRAITLARETCEELFEPYVHAALLDPNFNFVDEIERAFGGSKIDGIGRLMLQQIQDRVTKIRKDIEKELAPLNSTQNFEEQLNDKLKKVYKDEIEPFFARFLKVSPQGQALVAEMQAAISNQNSTSYSVNDLSFPQARLSEVAGNLGEVSNEERKKISIPQSNSLVISRESSPILSSILQRTRELIKERPQVVENPIEYKGAKYFTNANEHLKELLEIYVSEDNEQKPNKMTYVHEIFVQIRAAALQLDSEEIAAIFKVAAEGDDKFLEKFNRRNEWLAEANLTNMQTGRVCKATEDILDEMAAGRADVIDAVKKIFEAEIALDEKKVVELPQPTVQLGAATGSQKKHAVWVVIVDSSCAFEDQSNPLGAPKSKFDPYKENLYQFLLEARKAGADGYEVTTDRHPEDHHNFLKNLLKDEKFFQAYKQYILQELRDKHPNSRKSERDLCGEKIRLLNGENKEDIIKTLDSIAPFGLQVEMPQLLQVPSEDRKSIKTIGVKIGGVYYEAEDSENGIRVGDHVTNSLDLGKFTAVSSWPSHSFDKTMHYQEGDKTVHDFFKKEFNAGADINKTMSSVSEEGPVSFDNLYFDDDHTGLKVVYKGQDRKIENYSPFFNEALGVNQDALFAEVKALFEIARDVETLTIPVVGIAYDFCVKNRVLDTINFIAPALQALQIIAKNRVKIDDEIIKEVIENIAKIAGQQKVPVSVSDAIGLVISFEPEQIQEKDLLTLEVIIPQGATIAIIGEEHARAEMQGAAKKQPQVSFAEKEISQVFANMTGLSRTASAQSLLTQRGLDGFGQDL